MAVNAPTEASVRMLHTFSQASRGANCPSLEMLCPYWCLGVETIILSGILCPACDSNFGDSALTAFFLHSCSFSGAAGGIVLGANQS